MRTSPLFVGALSLVFLGAGCSLQPLSSTPAQPRGIADVKVTDKPQTETTKPSTTTKPEEMTKPETSPVATDEMTKPEETKPTGTLPGVSNGYGGKVIGSLNVKADANGVVAFFTAEKAEYKGSDAYMEFGCESVLVPVYRPITKTQSDLAEAVVQLITTKQNALADQGLRNAVAPSAPTIKLTNIHYDGKTRVVSFEGSFTSSGVCEDPRIKAQIEETIKLYAPDYRIELNGSEKNWRCLFDQSGKCE